MPLLRPSRTRPARRLHRRPLRLAPPAAHHPRAEFAAAAAEAAALHGRYRDLPISRQGTLHPDQLCGTPAFFVNGGPHHGAYDLAGLSATRKRAALGAVR
ncbi:hypothetical protein AQJ23_01140 [Streptomyces antibioticus]|nr:hypothetical protein AQJ23_01140 [Streptomyces antibioticus]